jgi:hypothetical protein
MATGETPDGKSHAFERPVRFNRFQGVNRTGGMKAAGSRLQRRQKAPVKPDGQAEAKNKEAAQTHIPSFVLASNFA